MQLDPMQVRLDELLRRLESRESLINTLQATQVPLNEDSQEIARWTTETTEPQQQPEDDAWWNGYDQWTGQGWSQGWNTWSNASWSNTKPTNNPATVPTRNGDAKLLMTLSLMSSCTREARTQVIIAFLFLERFLVSLAGREDTSGWLVILIDSLWTVDLNNSWNTCRQKMGIRRPQEEGMGFRRYIYEIKTCER